MKETVQAFDVQDDLLPILSSGGFQCANRVSGEVAFHVMADVASTSRAGLDPEGAHEYVPGHVSALKELRDVCADLLPGQMVCTSEYSLLESVTALQIMDPRMDSGMSPVPTHLAADCDKMPVGIPYVPAFDPSGPLSASDICWVMDRLLSCEMAWHKGAPLAQTIYTCLYVHSLSSMNPSAPQMTDNATKKLISMVLRPFLLAVLKSVGLVWDELTKGNLVDAEDFSGDKAGVSLLEDIHPDDILNLLQDAAAFLQGNEILGIVSSEEANALSLRIGLRQNFLKAVHVFATIDPTLRLGQGLDRIVVLKSLPEALLGTRACVDGLEGKDAAQITTLSSPAFVSAPSMRAVAVFDPWYARRPSQQSGSFQALAAAPPSLPLQLAPKDETLASVRSILRGFEQASELAAEGAGWIEWKTFLDQMAGEFQDQRTLPYVRSLWQSVIYCDGIVALRFGLEKIASDFLQQIGGLDTSDLLEMASSSQRDPDQSSTPLRKRMEHFLERLSSQLINHLSSLAQNRARSKRRLARSYQALRDLSEEAAALDESFRLLRITGESIPAITPAVQSLAFDTMLQIVLSGFELELYRKEEYAVAHWLARRIAEERIEILDTLLQLPDRRQDKSADFLRSQKRHSMAVVEQGQDITHTDTEPLVRRTLPWQPVDRRERSLGDAYEAIEKAAFFRRYKWLRGSDRPEDNKAMDDLWSDFQTSSKGRRESIARRVSKEYS